MTRWVEWEEPMSSEDYTTVIYCRSRVEDVITHMKKYQEKFKDHPNYPYKSDQAALDDFVVIHWGRIIDDGH